MTAIIDTPISLAEAARLIGKSARWINLLVQGGYIQKTPDNKYTPANVARGALRAALDDRKSTGHSAAIKDLAETKARIAKLKEEALAGTLVNLEEAGAEMDRLCAELFRRFDGLPAAFTRDLNDRKRLERMIAAI